MEEKGEAKQQIKKLIEKYERVKANKQIKKYDEANTRKDFIMPLFKALGWDVYNEFSREVVEEENVATGSVDYSFRINNIPKFLLEAKALKVDLDKEEWAKQAVSYGWNKAIPWVVLTDFEGLKLFNSDWLVDHPTPNLEFTCEQYLTRFEDLWYLSKQSIEEGELDAQAEKWGIKAKREPVSKKLAEDLLEWRQILFENLSAWNKEEDEALIEESVQRILDRFIFIRATEDRQIEPPILWPEMKKWEERGFQPSNFLQTLKPVFKHFDKTYNSNLFITHRCETLETEGEAFKKVIEDMYADKERGLKYDFAAIDADVLGSIYEQYLGTLLQKGPVGVVGEAVVGKSTAGGDYRKKKKRGIYYTPTYIVDYIVRNTLGVALKEKSLQEIKELKILDPACGSGSFLIKAFALVDQELKERQGLKGKQADALRKYQILTSNIYGVDLDNQAIEIARLNLLLKALEPDFKLPMLSDNTKVGNSLISGREGELQKYFGHEWKEKKPFNWGGGFPKVFEGGGFDIVVGNPPWGAEISKSEARFFSDNYPSSTKGHKDVYKIFIERGIQLLKKGGLLGFIVPNTLLYQSRYKDIRQFLLRYRILNIVDLGENVFEGVVPSCVIIVEKSPPEKSVKMTDLSAFKDNLEKSEKISTIAPIVVPQDVFEETPENSFLISLRKLKSGEEELEAVMDCRDAGVQYASPGIGVFQKGARKIGDRLIYKAEAKRKSHDKELLSGSNIKRFYLDPNCKEFLRGNFKEIVDEEKGEWVHFSKDIFDSPQRIIWRQTADRIIATVDATRKWFKKTVHAGVLKSEWKDKINIYYLLGLLNSSYLTYLYRQGVRETGRTFAQIKITKIRRLPVKIVPKAKQAPLVNLIKRRIQLAEALHAAKPDTEEFVAQESKIKNLDKKIDRLVYKLYNLTLEEIKIVEESLR